MITFIVSYLIAALAGFAVGVLYASTRAMRDLAELRAHRKRNTNDSWRVDTLMFEPHRAEADQAVLRGPKQKASRHGPN